MNDYFAAHWTELLGAVLGLVQIWLLVRRSIWNFPVAMVMVTLIGITLFEARLYSEAGLQAFFFVVNAIGWAQWNGVSKADDAVPVEWMDNRSRGIWALVTAALSLSLGCLMHRFTNAALPFADSAVTGASIAAQLLLNNRRIENWVLWVVIDLVSIGLYLYRDLTFLAILYVAFLFISILGLREWMRAARTSPSDKFCMISVCFHGAESTGKSVLAEKLAHEFGGTWVPEYGRTYCEERGTDLDMADLVAIAEGQATAVDAAMAANPKLLLLDTDQLMTAAWAEMLFGEVPEALTAYPKADLYLLFTPDVPWIDDGTRFFGKGPLRSRFAALAEEVLVRAGVKYVTVSGGWVEREKAARAAITALMAKHAVWPTK